MNNMCTLGAFFDEYLFIFFTSVSQHRRGETRNGDNRRIYIHRSDDSGFGIVYQRFGFSSSRVDYFRVFFSLTAAAVYDRFLPRTYLK